MANAWEYPGLNYEQGNYDFFICEVKTFNERLNTYQREVNERLASQDEAIAGFKNTVNTQINELRLETRQFEADLNERFADYTADQNARFVEQMRLLNERLNTINENIYNYLVENLPDIIDDMPQLQDDIILNQTEQVIFTATSSGWDSRAGTVTCNKTINDIMERYNNNTLQIWVVWMNIRFKVLPISVKNFPYQQHGSRLLIKGILVGGPGDGDTDTELSTFLINYADDGEGTIASNSLTYKAMPKFYALEKTVTITGGNYVDFDDVVIENNKYDHIEIVSFGVNSLDADNRPIKRYFPSDETENGGFDIQTKLDENAPTALYDTIHTRLIFPDDYTGTVTFFATLLLF